MCRNQTGLMGLKGLCEWESGEMMASQGGVGCSEREKEDGCPLAQTLQQSRKYFDCPFKVSMFPIGGLPAFLM